MDGSEKSIQRKLLFIIWKTLQIKLSIPPKKKKKLELWCNTCWVFISHVINHVRLAVAFWWHHQSGLFVAFLSLLTRISCFLCFLSFLCVFLLFHVSLGWRWILVGGWAWLDSWRRPATWLDGLYVNGCPPPPPPICWHEFNLNLLTICFSQNVFFFLVIMNFCQMKLVFFCFSLLHLCLVSLFSFFCSVLSEPVMKRLKTGLVGYAGDSSDDEEDRGTSRASWPGNSRAALPTSAPPGWTRGYRSAAPPPPRAKTQPQQQSIPFWMAP